MCLFKGDPKVELAPGRSENGIIPGSNIRGVHSNFESNKIVCPTKNSDKDDHTSAFVHENANEMVHNDTFSNFLIISNQIWSHLT